MPIRILDLPNLSNAKNPEADSGLRLQRELIAAVLRQRRDFIFYILCPPALAPMFHDLEESGRVHLISFDVTPRQRAGAFHLDLARLAAVLDLARLDIDLLFINQPEVAAPLLDFFNKVHFFDLPAFSYVHWMDWKRRDQARNRWNQPANLGILTGTLVSALTACNSRYGKERILGEAGRWFNSETLSRLEERLVPLPPGVDCRAILAARTMERFPCKTIVFPFRPQRYTGFKSLLEVHLSRLWERRKDFRLLLTNPSAYGYVRHLTRRFPFIEICRLDREAYLETLWKADLVVGCHDGSNQWSLAMLEALAAECVPLLSKGCFFGEMVLEVLPPAARTRFEERNFYFRHSFLSRLESLLDHLDEERQRAAELGQHIRSAYDWDVRIGDWIRCFERVDDASPRISEASQSIGMVERLLAARGRCGKEEILRCLGWHPKSRHISWTKYRKYLREKGLEVGNGFEAVYGSGLEADPAPTGVFEATEGVLDDAS